jgi:hypothetical protein
MSAVVDETRDEIAKFSRSEMLQALGYAQLSQGPPSVHRMTEEATSHLRRLEVEGTT